MKIKTPPIKIQGIKTKLIPLILHNIEKINYDIWIEPFSGSAVVALNVLPKKAILCDKNPHLINFYNSIKEKKITSYIVREFLEQEGELLSEKGQNHYYSIRKRFNEKYDSLDFLFLNRSCFNGMIRFNKKMKFNVPFCHKPNRFSKSYITKIVNQVKQIEQALEMCNWEFKIQDFRKTISQAKNTDFIYCDPPYIDRHVDYFDTWDKYREIELNKALIETEAKFLLSTWHSNRYRKNNYINTLWKNCHLVTKEHFYHIGGKEKNRNTMLEALIANYELKPLSNNAKKKEKQLYLF